MGGPYDCTVMDSLYPIPRPRRQVIQLGLLLAGLVIAGCAPPPPPAPGSWQEEYYRRKQKYREWGQGHDNASAR
jgi:hypothetical protein